MDHRFERAESEKPDQQRKPELRAAKSDETT
jgi:hypothetical protein